MGEKNDAAPVAIAIDTSCFEQYKFAFKSSLLGRLSQFKESEIKVLVPEVVRHEVVSHLERDLDSSYGALRRAVRDTTNPWGTTRGQREEAIRILTSGDEPKRRATEEFNGFLESCDAIVLGVEDVGNVRKIFELYFSSDPPFSSGEKKCEFPDAFALISLEEWAIKNGQVVVVSNDDDWGRYCSSATGLIFRRSLAEALSEFQEESASYLANEFSDGAAENRWNIVEKVLTCISEQSDVIEFEASIDSQFHADDDGSFAVLSLVDDAFSDVGVEVVELDYEKVVFNVSIPLLAKIETEANFKKWDSIDREYNSMGGATLMAEEELLANFLISCSIRGNGSIGDVESVALEPDRHTVCYYDAEPAWMSDPSSYADGDE